MKPIKSLKNKPRAVSMLLLFPNKRILTLTDAKSNKLDFPGGMMENYDKTPWNAIKREFREETGHQLPSSYDIKKLIKFITPNNTLVYLAYTDVAFPDKLGKNSNCEASDMAIISFDELQEKIRTNQVRNSVINSAKFIINEFN